MLLAVALVAAVAVFGAAVGCLNKCSCVVSHWQYLCAAVTAFGAAAEDTGLCSQDGSEMLVV